MVWWFPMVLGCAPDGLDGGGADDTAATESTCHEDTPVENTLSSWDAELATGLTVRDYLGALETTTSGAFLWDDGSATVLSIRVTGTVATEEVAGPPERCPYSLRAGVHFEIQTDDGHLDAELDGNYVFSSLDHLASLIGTSIGGLGVSEGITGLEPLADGSTFYFVAAWLDGNYFEGALTERWSEGDGWGYECTRGTIESEIPGCTKWVDEGDH